MCRSHLRIDHRVFSFLRMNPLRTVSRWLPLGIEPGVGATSRSGRLVDIDWNWPRCMSWFHILKQWLELSLFWNIPAGHHVSPAWHWRDIKLLHLCSSTLSGWCLLGTDSRNGILLDPVLWSSGTQLIILDSAWLRSRPSCPTSSMASTRFCHSWFCLG